MSLSIAKLKAEKVPGSSGIVSEMLKSSGNSQNGCCSRKCCMITEDAVPTDWERGHIINLFKGKGDALERGNYRGPKLFM